MYSALLFVKVKFTSEMLKQKLIFQILFIFKNCNEILILK